MPPTQDRQQLTDVYDKLNPAGKAKVIEYASDLSEQRKYTVTETFRHKSSFDLAVDITPDFEKVGAKNND